MSCRPFPPGKRALAGRVGAIDRARGFRLDGYGVFFDVDVVFAILSDEYVQEAFMGG